jgi:hypothetical protein
LGFPTLGLAATHCKFHFEVYSCEFYPVLCRHPSELFESILFHWVLSWNFTGWTRSMISRKLTLHQYGHTPLLNTLLTPREFWFFPTLAGGNRNCFWLCTISSHPSTWSFSWPSRSFPTGECWWGLSWRLRLDRDSLEIPRTHSPSLCLSLCPSLFLTTIYRHFGPPWLPAPSSHLRDHWTPPGPPLLPQPVTSVQVRAKALGSLSSLRGSLFCCCCRMSGKPLFIYFVWYSNCLKKERKYSPTHCILARSRYLIYSFNSYGIDLMIFATKISEPQDDKII